MNITNNYQVLIFRQEYQGKIYYSVGLSKKNQDGSYINGYMPVQFKKGVNLDNQTNIYIKKAWLTFYLKDKKTVPYIFISEFETVDQTIQRIKKENEDPYASFGNSIRVEDIDDNDLPF